MQTAFQGPRTGATGRESRNVRNRTGQTDADPATLIGKLAVPLDERTGNRRACRKSQIRSTKSEGNPKFQNSKRPDVDRFGFWICEFPSDFGFGLSDFENEGGNRRSALGKGRSVIERERCRTPIPPSPYRPLLRDEAFATKTGVSIPDAKRENNRRYGVFTPFSAPWGAFRVRQGDIRRARRVRNGPRFTSRQGVDENLRTSGKLQGIDRFLR